MSAIDRLYKLVGRRTESPSPPYECEGCGERFPIEHYCCPECGCFRVDRRDWCGAEMPE